MDYRTMFYNNPTINPYTGRAIQIGAGTYNKLVKEFGVPPGQNIQPIFYPMTPRTIMPAINIKPRIEKLSGVSSWYCFDYMGRRYNFFGDIHNRGDVLTKNCESTGEICTKLDDNLSLELPSRKCWEFPAYLDIWLKYNAVNNIITDLHIEMPYRKGGHDYRDYETIKRDPNAEYAGTIQLKLIQFGCLRLNKQLCLYGPNIRVHYSNLRAMVGKNILLIFSFAPYIDRLQLDNYNPQSINDLYIITSFIINNAQRIFRTLYSEDNFINNIERLITEVLLLNTSFGSWYKNYFSNELYLSKQISSIRDGKRMHKLAVQLRALRLDGQGGVANLIVQYFTTKLDYYINNFARPGLNRWYQEMQKGQNRGILTYNLNNDAFWLSIFMNDVYFLARMFRFRDSTQVIGLSHEGHTDVWADFFINYLGVQPVAYVPSITDWNFGGTDTWTRCITSTQLQTYTFPGI